MESEALNMSIRKFLKSVGVRSQLEIEKAVNDAIQTGAIRGNETFPATMILEIQGLRLKIPFEGKIELE